MNKEMEKTKIISFTDLNAWKEGHLIVIDIYRITKTFPREEMFGLTSQMRRCAVSITSNIAEGFSRRSYREKIQFFSISQGSVTELQNQLLVAHDIGYLSDAEFQNLDNRLITLHKIINGLIKKTRSFL